MKVNSKNSKIKKMNYMNYFIDCNLRLNISMVY